MKKILFQNIIIYDNIITGHENINVDMIDFSWPLKSNIVNFIRVIKAK